MQLHVVVITKAHRIKSMKAYARARRLLEGTGSATGSALGPSNSSPTDSEIREVPNFL